MISYLSVRDFKFMEQSSRQRNESLIGLEELPIELLVYIFSFLPTSRDLVRLRFVSRKIRSISEVPSLWNTFLWPWYDKREERSVNDVLKVCGTYVNQLIFPDVIGCVRTSVQCHEWGDLACGLYVSRTHIQEVIEKLSVMAPSTAMKMLRHCCNVTKVTLGICLNGDEVKEIVEKMKHLRKLEICLSEPIKPIIAVVSCANLEKLVLCGFNVQYDRYIKQECLSEWVRVGFRPPNLSLVFHEDTWMCNNDLPEILQQWPQWNSQIPAGHTACFSVYYTECTPLDTSSAVPALQLDFGQTATYPCVKASDFGLFGFGKDLLLLTNSTGDGKIVHKASVIQSDQFLFYTSNLCCNVSGLNFVTDFIATSCGLLSGHLEQLSIACPNLERLNLRSNTSCLESLQGLRSIVDHCHNLQAVNLEGVHVTKIENCIKFWEVLSKIKMLNHLRIEMCAMKPFIEIDICSQHSFVQLACKFIHLKQLELMFRDDPCKPFSGKSNQVYLVLSHFPSLACCFAETRTMNTAVDIITNCKYLKCFKCDCWGLYFNKQSLPTVLNMYLQYLDIHLKKGGIGEVFMDSVSAHGKLEIVILVVSSVTENGITALIENSPKLHLFKIHFNRGSGFFDKKHEQLRSFKDTLKKKLLHRKLFNLDGFIITGSIHENNRSTRTSTSTRITI